MISRHGAKFLFATFILFAAILPQDTSANTSAARERNPALRWASTSIKFSISSSIASPTEPAFASISDPVAAIERGADAWSSISSIRFAFVKTTKLSVSPAGVRGDGINLITIAATAENLALFPDGAQSPPAVTRIFFNKFGFITETDIVLNPFVRFTDQGDFGYDLETVLTHEFGHALGLEHSPIPASVMYQDLEIADSAYSKSSATPRLAEVDISAVRAKYGSQEGESDCCAAILGTVYPPDGGHLAADIWAEDSKGRLVSYTRSRSDGFFALRGLSTGSYSVYAQLPEYGYSAVMISAPPDLTPGDVAKVGIHLEPSRDLPVIHTFGFNDGLSRRSVVFSDTRQGQLFLHGSQIIPGSVNVGFSTAQIKAQSQAAFPVGFGLSIIAAAIPVLFEPNGDYGEFSFFVQNSSGRRVYCIGCIRIAPGRAVESLTIK